MKKLKIKKGIKESAMKIKNKKSQNHVYLKIKNKNFTQKIKNVKFKLK